MLLKIAFEKRGLMIRVFLETLNFQETHAMSVAKKQLGEMLERARICNKFQPKFQILVQVDQVDTNALDNINMIHPQLVYETFLG